MHESAWDVDAFDATHGVRDDSVPISFWDRSSVTHGVLNDRRCTRWDSVPERRRADIPTEVGRSELEQTTSPVHCDVLATHPKSPARVRECAEAGDSETRSVGVPGSSLGTIESKSSTN